METLHGNAQHLLKREQIKVLEKTLVPIAFEFKCWRMNTLWGTTLHGSGYWAAENSDLWGLFLAPMIATGEEQFSNGWTWSLLVFLVNS